MWVLHLNQTYQHDFRSKRSCDYRYGIRGPTLKWIQAFLSDRSQTVVLENEKSNIVPVTCGVPQGSALGPHLFLIYINDLPSSTNYKVRWIADDTAINLAVSSLEDAQSLQQDLDLLNKWELEWNMEFNHSKCVVIRDFLMAFWLSPEVSTWDPIISFTCSSRANIGRGLILKGDNQNPML